MADFPATTTEMGDLISEMTLKDVALLTAYLEEKYDLKGSSGGGGVVAPDTTQPTEQAAVQTEFTVTLDGFDAAKKISVIKVVREITGCGLAEGKTLVESAPKPIKENLPKEEAEALKKKLEEAGGKVSIK